MKMKSLFPLAKIVSKLLAMYVLTILAIALTFGVVMTTLLLKLVVIIAAVTFWGWVATKAYRVNYGSAVVFDLIIISLLLIVASFGYLTVAFVGCALSFALAAIGSTKGAIIYFKRRRRLRRLAEV
jgi:hypothetical protein